MSSVQKSTMMILDLHYYLGGLMMGKEKVLKKEGKKKPKEEKAKKEKKKYE